jgi:hypothetical protein
MRHVRKPVLAAAAYIGIFRSATPTYYLVFYFCINKSLSLSLGKIKMFLEFSLTLELDILNNIIKFLAMDMKKKLTLS